MTPTQGSNSWLREFLRARWNEVHDSMVAPFLYTARHNKLAFACAGGYLLIWVGAFFFKDSAAPRSGLADRLVAVPVVARGDAPSDSWLKPAPDPAASPQLPEHEIVTVEPNSPLRGIRRLAVKVRVATVPTQSELERISMQVVDRVTDAAGFNGIVINYYEKGTELDGSFTAGQAIWAPYGEWSRANEVSPGDYSKHLLSVTPGPALDWKWKEIAVRLESQGLTEKLRKEIFYEVTRLQDSGVRGAESHSRIAERYKIDVGVSRDIMYEGVGRNWPMPKAVR